MADQYDYSLILSQQETFANILEYSRIFGLQRILTNKKLVCAHVMMQV